MRAGINFEAWLVLALRGTKREQAGAAKRTRLPITPVILEKLRRVWNRDPSNADHLMMWAACIGYKVYQFHLCYWKMWCRCLPAEQKVLLLPGQVRMTAASLGLDLPAKGVEQLSPASRCPVGLLPDGHVHYGFRNLCWLGLCFRHLLQKGRDAVS